MPPALTEPGQKRALHINRRCRVGYCRVPVRLRKRRNQPSSSSVGEARRREPAVVCQQPTVVRSAQFRDRQRSRPRGRRDYRNRGEPVVRSPTEAIARRPTATSRGSTCASSGPCSRPPARGTTAECVANQQCSPMTYKSSSAASDVSLAPFGLRIIRAMQPSTARGETAECVATALAPPRPVAKLLKLGGQPGLAGVLRIARIRASGP